MKKNLIILMIIIIALQQFTVSAQDLLVTADGDSLNCRITKIKGDYVYFTFKHQNEVRNTLLPKPQVKYYQYNYHSIADVQSHQIVGYKPEFQHVRLAVSGGWSYRTAPIAKGLDPGEIEYVKKLRHGLNFSMDASYFFSEMFGAGVKYDLFKASNSTLWGEDHISINYAGPVFAMRFFNQSKTNCWLINYSIGYMGYTDRGKAAGIPELIKGSTVGTVIDIGYDIALSKNWSACLQLSMLSGILTEYDETINGITQTIKLEDQKEGLMRLNISIGLRCNL
jgi:hypothetical protein